MNCIAIDDEPLALKVISEFCEKIEFLHLQETFTNPLDAISIIQKGDVDLVFLDIHMPNISGLEFLRSLPRPPVVIFTTAYTQYALEGFELDAADYLVKPIPFDRFLRAVNKANDMLISRKNINEKFNHHGNSDYFMVKSEYKTIKVNFKDILFIEGVKDYVKIHTADKNILTKTTMKNIEEKLPSHTFFRVHRSFIVSLKHIYAIENHRIIIKDKRIPIGEMYKENFYKVLENKKI